MIQKAKRIVALILSMLMILSSVTVYAADNNTDTQPTGHTLTINVAGDGNVEVNGEGVTESADNSYSVPPETTVTVTATPGEGMQLSGIMLDGVMQSETFLMPDQDATLDITFEAVPQPANVEEDNENPEPETTDEPADMEETTGVKGNVNSFVPAVGGSKPGIDMSSYVMLATTRSSGIPSVGDQVTGTCYIGDTWNVNYPYQDYFYVNNFSGDLAGAVTVQDFECLDPTAALPHNMNASYAATVTEVNVSAGYVEYYVRVTPPGATDGVTTDGSGHLTGYQHVGGKVRVTRQFVGAIELQKSSANPELTEGNSCYSLAGAVYGVYSGSSKIAELTTNSNGYAKVDNIPAGSYTVKEITAPKGYALDVIGHNVTVTSGQTATLRVTDLPQSDPVSVLLGKIDAETTQDMPQGSASLENAEFTVKYYDGFYDTDPAEEGEEAVRTWVLKTNASGKTAMTDDLKVSGDQFYKNSNGYNTLPLGTITIQETKAPTGYLLNDEVFVRQITSEGTVEGVTTYNAPTIPEEIIRGDIQIVKYGENNAETDDSSADIKRPLEGVKFHLESKTTGEVYTIITDEQGIASTTQLRDEDNERGGLPFDTYIVTEESPYPEYDPVAPFEVTIDTEGKTLYYILRNDTVDAPIRIEKIDETTGKVIPAAGARFQVLDEDKNPVKMTVSHYPSLAETDTFETDDNGMFVLPEKLEYGKYYLHEVEAPEGYLLGGEDIPFTVDQEYQWDDPLTIQYADAPAKGKIRITKTDAETDEVIPSGAEFTVTAAEDITTPDGTVRVTAGTVVDTVTTGQDGTAETSELFLGKYIAKETEAPEGYILNETEFEVELVYKDQYTEVVYGNVTVPDELAKGKIRITKTDSETGKIIPSGAEFTITATEDIVTPDGMVKVTEGTVVDTVTTGQNGVAETLELYLGKYVVKETKAPEGYILNEAEFEVELVYEDQYTEIVYSSTTVPDAPAMGRIEIVKTDSETGDQLEGAEFTVTAAEDIITPDGTVRAAAGDVVDTVVSGEEGTAISKNLYLGKYTVTETQQPAGYVLPDQSWEVELTYKDQDTELVTETLEVENDATIVIIDKKVTGSEQRLSGVKFAVWNKDTEDPFDPGMTYKDIYKTDREGKIRLERFVPGTYCIREVQGVPGYAIDSTIHEFTITADGRVDGQAETTITIENAKTEIVETNALNLGTGDQNAYPKKIDATDTVSINNLQPEMEYTLTWVVADALTGQPLRKGDLLTGDLITGEQIFTATEAQMDIVQDISFDASEFAGRTLVIYEYLYQEDILISEHTNPDDAKQQLYIRNPELHTTAIDVESGTHEAIAKDNVTIRDIVDHFDILPGTYTLRGIVMDQTTGKPLLIDGEMVTAEKEIQVTEEDGTVNMEFSFDASELNNRSIVIYEYLYQDNELITSHEDINDKDQTITFKVGKLTVDMPGNGGNGISVKTGDSGSTIYYIIGAMLIAVGMTGITLYKRKEGGKSEEK